MTAPSKGAPECSSSLSAQDHMVMKEVYARVCVVYPDDHTDNDTLTTEVTTGFGTLGQASSTHPATACQKILIAIQTSTQCHLSMLRGLL